jgi:hypothetical protein
MAMGTLSVKAGELANFLEMKSAIPEAKEEHSPQFNLNTHDAWTFWEGIKKRGF